MSALDLLGIADALAERYSAAELTAPSGLTTVRGSTARLPNNIPAMPFVGVFPPAGSSITYTGQRRMEHLFAVRFFFGESAGDLSRNLVALYRWWTVLADQTHAATKLGVAAVMKALPESYTIGTFEYAGTSYDGIEFAVRVWTEDEVTLVA